MAARRLRRGAERPHLVVRLRKGWSYDASRRRFSKRGEEPVVPVPGTDLPKFTRIRFQIPALARKRRRTEAEDELARGVQIVPPADTSLARLVRRIQKWPCVESAWVAPTPEPAKRPARPSAPRIR